MYFSDYLKTDLSNIKNIISFNFLTITGMELFLKGRGENEIMFTRQIKDPVRIICILLNSMLGVAM